MADRLLTVVASTPPHPVARDGDAPHRIRELDRVELLAGVLGDEEVAVPAGAVGTVVSVWAEGAAFEVEFTQPVDALATVDAGLLRVVERAPA
ncbi:DUF4926 domain-containing protein [Methylobacterium oryzihabitans]|uniref:DUF4926 domain-containing protein n=1 Tax=Methylobacterium oryzihabitans TaxID=2499852 RepID=A0A437PI42_9HYPH|nr:DUF4926 domain-containing protein [Methylobacterium oryzihabitans]RVU21925.1 DUF4926 domain-containing protein [Methylobacterium oryzihabitans]